MNPHVPQPRKILSIEEFLDSLDKANSATQRVRKIFDSCSGNIMRIYKKDSSLREIVIGSLSPFRLPVIDKPLRVVIEARDDHQKLAGALFCYYVTAAGIDPDTYNDQIWADMYVKNGYGYFFTGGWGRTRDVVISDTYQPDMYDLELLNDLKLR